MLADPGRQPGENGLGLRIAKPAVELQDVRRPVRRHHQAGIENPDVRRTPYGELVEGRLKDLTPDPLDQPVARERHRAVGAHAAGVGPGVALAQPLVVLRGRQYQQPPAVGQRQHRQLLAREKRFDDDFAPRVAELVPREHRPRRVRCLGAGRAHDHPFAGGEPGRLDDEWLGVCGDVAERGGEVGEGAARRGGDAGGRHHFLGERLGGLDARGGGAGPEHRMPTLAQAVGEAEGEGRLRPDDREVDAVLLHRLHNLQNLPRRNWEVGAELGGAGIAWSGEEGRGGGGEVAFERPSERMLAAAPADDQDSHFFLNASVKACAARRAPSTTSFTASFASFM